MQVIYLAAPYSHPDPAVRHRRAHQAAAVAADLAASGYCVFSPITHGHQLASYLPHEVAQDHEFWMKQCLPILSLADALVILPIDGWRESRGVWLEIEHARREDLAKPIHVIQGLPRPWHARLELLDDEELEACGWQALLPE